MFKVIHYKVNWQDNKEITSKRIRITKTLMKIDSFCLNFLESKISSKDSLKNVGDVRFLNVRGWFYNILSMNHLILITY